MPLNVWGLLLVLARSNVDASISVISLMVFAKQACIHSGLKERSVYQAMH
jgi:hypothetical protein